MAIYKTACILFVGIVLRKLGVHLTEEGNIANADSYMVINMNNFLY